MPLTTAVLVSLQAQASLAVLTVKNFAQKCCLMKYLGFQTLIIICKQCSCKRLPQKTKPNSQIFTLVNTRNFNSSITVLTDTWTWGDPQ